MSSRNLHFAAALALAGSSLALLAVGNAHARKLIIPRVHSSSDSAASSSAPSAELVRQATAKDADAPILTSPDTPSVPNGAVAVDTPPANVPPSTRVTPTGTAAKGADGKAATAAAIAASRAAADRQDRASDEGIDESRDVVKPILARHPDSNLVICVAGCGPDPQIVQVLPRTPEKKTESEVVPSSAGVPGALEVDPKPSSGDIICVAGCKGPRGEVIHRRARISWIEPDENDAIRHTLRKVAERLAGELRAIAMAEEASTITAWSAMSRHVIDASGNRSSLADASADEPGR